MGEGLRNGSCVISGPSARKAGLTNRLKIICDTPDEVLERVYGDTIPAELEVAALKSVQVILHHLDAR